jgi:zinc protease
VQAVIDDLINNGASEEELTKVKNQAESTIEFGEVEVMNRAMNLAFARLSGDAQLVNEEIQRIEEVTLQDIQRVGKTLLREENSNTLYYKASKVSS